MRLHGSQECGAFFKIIDMKEKILNAVMEYLADEEGYGDNAQLRINPCTGEVDVVDIEEAEEAEKCNEPDCPGYDYYDIMDLLEMNPEDGRWLPSTEAIESVADEYAQG